MSTSAVEGWHVTEYISTVGILASGCVYMSLVRVLFFLRPSARNFAPSAPTSLYDSVIKVAFVLIAMKSEICFAPSDPILLSSKLRPRWLRDSASAESGNGRHHGHTFGDEKRREAGALDSFKVRLVRQSGEEHRTGFIVETDFIQIEAIEVLAQVQAPPQLFRILHRRWRHLPKVELMHTAEHVGDRLTVERRDSILVGAVCELLALDPLDKAI
mmetsp:Transcript_42691/g.106430  ORF Transcript_42691/g.106430 Transcript_42691/m.106430 type:complete len:215 (-) Transcript_42691:849-1493(-)